MSVEKKKAFKVKSWDIYLHDYDIFVQGKFSLTLEEYLDRIREVLQESIDFVKDPYDFFKVECIGGSRDNYPAGEICFYRWETDEELEKRLKKTRVAKEKRQIRAKEAKEKKEAQERRELERLKKKYEGSI